MLNNKNIIKRAIFQNILSHLEEKEISLIIGPRQVGKTTLMMEAKRYLDGKKKNTLFLSLDFERDKEFFNSQDSLINKIKLEFGEEKSFVFLDEIQRKENAGLFLKGIYDMGLPYKFIVSGSGSLELKEKIHESLAGRKRVFELKPISFLEFVNFKTDYKYEDRIEKFFDLEDKKTKNLFDEYIRFGGYPRVILNDTLEKKIQTIDEIFASYLEKDISYWLEVEKLDAFRNLVKVLSDSAGKILNYSEISNILGISANTTKNYLYYLEKTFIIKKITPYFTNTRKEITKSPSVYFYDLGLKNYALGVLKKDSLSAEVSGFLFQNFIFNILLDKIRFSGADIHFWRTQTGAEVDFVINTGRQVVPVEIKYKDFKKPMIERSLRSFIEKYKPAKALVVNKSLKDRMIIGKTKVEFLPFAELMKYKSS